MCAAKNPLDLGSSRFEDRPAMKRAGGTCGGRKTRDERSASTAWRTAETIGAAIVTNIVATVHRRRNPAITFLSYGLQKIARIGVAVQSRFGDSGRIEPALECEPRFLGRIIKRADDKIFARVTTWPARQFVIFGSEALRNLRPWDFGRCFRNDREGAERDRRGDRSTRFAFTCRCGCSPRTRAARQLR